VNTLASLIFLVLVLILQISVALRLDRKVRLKEKWYRKIGRRMFYTFVILEMTSFLLVCFIFFLAIFVHGMPLNWELMHSFGKYQASLGNPADFSLILGIFGIPFAVLSILFAFKFLRLLQAVLITFFNYFLHAYIVHWLVD